MAVMLSTTPLDVKLDVNGDIDMSAGYPVLISGVDGVAQLCRQALLTFRGEWFLDRTVGIPYYANDFVTNAEALLEQKFDQARVIRTFTLELLKVPGVAKVTQMSVTFDNQTRKLSVSFEVRTEFGDTVDSDVLIGAS